MYVVDIDIGLLWEGVVAVFAYGEWYGPGVEELA